MSCNNAQTAWNAFFRDHKIVESVDIPMRIRRTGNASKHKTRWFNDEIKNLIKEKDAAHCKKKQTGDPADEATYIQLRREEKKLTNRSKKN